MNSVEDHVFGTYSTDALKALRERTAAAGVQHRARVLPLDPGPDQPFELIVTSGPDVTVGGIELWYTTDDSPPSERSSRRVFELHERQWHTLAWGYVSEWRVRFDGFPDGTLLRYRIRARLASGEWRWADWPDPKHVIEMALINVTHDEEQAVTSFGLSMDSFSPPAWAESALVYQVFLDRFARADAAPWPDRETLSDLFGGTLRGVIQKLDHIESLGATCIWLSPIFPSGTHHGYDGTNYTQVEPRLGGMEDLRELVDEAHTRGIRVLLDLVANHVSHKHPYFLEARADSESPYRDWFKIDNRFEPHGYRAFFNNESMPELDTERPDVQRYLIDAAQYWVETRDVDGFRLDYAHGPSHAFWARFWRSLKRIKPEIWCIGEVVEIPSLQRRYSGYLDGLLDFQLEDVLRRTFGHRTRDLVAWESFRAAHEADLPPHSQFSRPLFLDNHDSNRFLWIAGGRTDQLRLAALVMYSLPNTPILYYGTEVGLSQRDSTAILGLEASREPMPWDHSCSATELLRYFQRLGHLRQSEPAMRAPCRETLSLTSEQMIQRLPHGDCSLLLVVNRSDRPTTLTHDRLCGTFEALVGEKTLELQGSMSLPPMSGELLKPTS